ncbi:MAG: hypothetical protein Q4C88_05950 [Akkermansia sp.]|nr:hypothetical protein [Akkermansia sp.]
MNRLEVSRFTHARLKKLAASKKMTVEQLLDFILKKGVRHLEAQEV